MWPGAWSTRCLLSTEGQTDPKHSGCHKGRPTRLLIHRRGLNSKWDNFSESMAALHGGPGFKEALGGCPVAGRAACHPPTAHCCRWHAAGAGSWPLSGIRKTAAALWKAPLASGNCLLLLSQGEKKCGGIQSRKTFYLGFRVF